MTQRQQCECAARRTKDRRACRVEVNKEGDLKALSNTNLLFKYADDTNLLVPEIIDVYINDEFSNVLKWDC